MAFFRYVLIQVLAYIVDMGGYVLCLATGIFNPVAANVLVKLAAGLFAFVAHRHFTFQSGASADRAHQAVRYFILLGLNVPFASLLLALILFWITDPVIAKFLSDVVSVGSSFWLSKRFVFISRQRRDENNPDGLAK